jgi:hypothetical protein
MPLANLSKMRREKTQISKTRNEKGEITKNTSEIQRVITDYFENLYSNKLENLEEMDKFLDTYDHPKQNQEEMNYLNRCIIYNEIEAAIVAQKKKVHNLMDSMLNSTRLLKKNLCQHSLILPMKYKEKGHSLTHSILSFSGKRKLARFRRPKVTCSLSYADYRPKTNAEILLEWVTH